MRVRALTGSQRGRLICGWIDGSQIVDMLVRHTVFETIVLLSREKVDGHIEVDLNVEKLEDKLGH